MKAGAWVLCLVLVLGSGALAETSARALRDADTRMLQVGDTLESVLAALNAQGFRVVYSSALVRPEMILRTRPSAARVDELLREILTPWKLRAVPASNGDWLVTRQEATGPAAMPAASPESIEVIDVTATRIALAVTGASEVFLAREDVQRMPHLADDAMRMLKVLPGTSGGDISAALNVRGGMRDEALLTIDGAEIHNAFHFRDLDDALSVLDTSLVEGIDFVTGGMTADVGDYMSGSIGLQTRRPAAGDEYRSGVGISFVSAFARTSGTFANDRGSYLVSARRGFLDLLISEVVDAEEYMKPRYADVFAAVDFDLGDHTRVGARLLVSDDDLVYYIKDEDDDTSSTGGGASQHLWLTLDHAFTDEVDSRTLLSASTVRQRRDATGFDEQRSGEMHGDNEFTFFDLRQDWTWKPGETQLARWGITYGQQQGDYDYSLVSQIFDPVITPVPIDKVYATDMDAELRKFGAYAAWRTRFTSQLTAEAGVRWDNYEYQPGATYDAVSPRINVVYSFGDSNELRVAWGDMYQPQAVDELQVEDNLTAFGAPERVRQVVIGYTRRFSEGFSARIDIYDKQYRDLRPRFENALDAVQLIPEGAPDRVRIDAPEARARGVEVTVRRDVQRGFSGWLSYVHARAEDLQDGSWVPRSWDQRHSLFFGGSWTGASWNVSVAGQAHSGAPTTQIGIETTRLPDGSYEVQGTAGPRNGERLDTYARLDLRVNRDVILQNSKLSLYLEVTNLTDQENQCCVERYSVVPRPGGVPLLEIEKGFWLPRMPSLGVEWHF